MKRLIDLFAFLAVLAPTVNGQTINSCDQVEYDSESQYLSGTTWHCALTSTESSVSDISIEYSADDFEDLTGKALDDGGLQTGEQVNQPANYKVLAAHSNDFDDNWRMISEDRYGDYRGFLTSQLEQIDCEEGTYSADLGKCLYEPAVEETYDTGTYNSTTELCEVTAPAEQVCEQGEYNAADGTCEYEPPVEHICSRGYFDASRELCLAEGTVEPVCPENATLQDGTCELQPQLVKQTPPEQLWLGVQRTLARYPVQIGAVAGLLVVGGIAVVLWLRRRT